MKRNSIGTLRAAVPAFAAAALVASTIVLTACSGRAETAAAAQPPASPPLVEVAQVLARKVTDFDEFTRHFEAVEHVDVRPRVSGYVASVNFVQGREVHKGEVLFVIDPRPYEDALKQARAQLAQARSQRDRAARLIDQHAISRDDYDTRIAAAQQASANVDAAQAAVDTAALNLSFTYVGVRRLAGPRSRESSRLARLERRASSV